MKKILIYEANSSQAQAIAKYIKRYSSFLVIGVVEYNTRFNKKYFDEIIVENILKINIDKYDYILPMGANSTYKIISKYKRLQYNNNIVFIDKNLIVFDKPKMLNIANNLNIPIPKTFYKKKDIKYFPIFYKENFENGRGIRGVARIEAELPQKHELLYQEYIDTPSTYGVAFFAQEGKVLTHTVYKEVISYPKDGGSAIVIEKFKDDQLIKYTLKLLNTIKYSGWGVAEYKYCKKRNDFVFMEINAKFWASIEFVLNDNPLFLEYLLNIKYKKKINNMIFINRLFQYDFIDILKNLKYLWGRKIIKESSLTYQIIRKLIPNILVNFIRKINKIVNSLININFKFKGYKKDENDKQTKI